MLKAVQVDELGDHLCFSIDSSHVLLLHIQIAVVTLAIGRI